MPAAALTTALERIEQASLEGERGRAPTLALCSPHLLREQRTDRGVLPSVCARMPRMSALKLVLWGFLAVLGSVALAFVTGLVNPQEKVNGLWLVVAG